MSKNTVHYISTNKLTLDDLAKIHEGKVMIELSDEAKAKIVRCREYLDEKLQNSNQAIYGINTGFGSLYNKNIPYSQLEKLQENLVKSHASGTGAEVPEEIIRLMLFLKVQSLAYGYSGVQLSTVQRLANMFNEDILPVVYEIGSLGASGDLAPLAHLSLPLIGLGEVQYQENKFSGEAINQKLQWPSLHLKAKEGLALLNGTQFMSAYGVWCTLHAHRLLKLANIIGALSLDAFDGRIEPFLPQVNAIRPQLGQIKTAEDFIRILKDSELIGQAKKHVQDPYSFRCIPQVHGTTADAIDVCNQHIPNRSE